MILVTGATGFIGRNLIRRLALDAGLELRVLLRPGTDPSRLPRGVALDTAVAALNDRAGLREAVKGIHTVIHLVGTDTRGRHASFESVDIEGTQNLLEAARSARVGRFIYLSRIGADRSSAFEMLRVKGQIEEMVRQSGMAYTIVRSGPVFGPDDHFSEHIAMLAAGFPVYFVPGDGEMTLQPIYIDDLTTCLTMALDSLELLDRSIELGGPEILPYRRLVMRIMYVAGLQRPVIGVPMLLLRAGGWYLDGLFNRWPFTTLWAEMLSTTQSAELGTIERDFGFRPTALDVAALKTYMNGRRYLLQLLQFSLSGRW